MFSRSRPSEPRRDSGRSRPAALRHAAEQDRIVAIVDRLDVEHRLGPQVAGVIAGPLAERPFDALVAGLDEALDDDLGIGRDRQPGDGALTTSTGLPRMPPTTSYSLTP
jgi:hypothetical protein